MIKVEGFMAFKGVMKIIPKTDKIKPFEICADWLYKPSCDCWYGNGSSYPSEVCEIVSEIGSGAQKEKKFSAWVHGDHGPHCRECGGYAPDGIETPYCPHCGAEMV